MLALADSREIRAPPVPKAPSEKSALADSKGTQGLAGPPEIPEMLALADSREIRGPRAPEALPAIPALRDPKGTQELPDPPEVLEMLALADSREIRGPRAPKAPSEKSGLAARRVLMVPLDPPA